MVGVDQRWNKYFHYHRARNFNNSILNVVDGVVEPVRKSSIADEPSLMVGTDMISVESSKINWHGPLGFTGVSALTSPVYTFVFSLYQHRLGIDQIWHKKKKQNKKKRGHTLHKTELRSKVSWWWMTTGLAIFSATTVDNTSIYKPQPLFEDNVTYCTRIMPCCPVDSRDL